MRKSSRDLISETQAAYFAGLFDGEGCVMIHVRDRVTSLTLTVTNSDLRPLTRLKLIYGGSIWPMPQVEGRRPVWAWRISGRKSLAFVHDILPYTIIKSEQLQLFFECAATLKSGKVMTDELLAYRQGVASQIKDLRRRDWERV